MVAATNINHGPPTIAKKEAVELNLEREPGKARDDYSGVETTSLERAVPELES